MIPIRRRDLSWEEYVQAREVRRERSRRKWAEIDASSDPLAFRVDRYMARELSTSTTQVVYALEDPRDGRTRYIGHTGRVQQRYQQHCRGMACPIPGVSNFGDYYATCSEASAADEPETYRFWMHDLHEHRMRPTLRILEAVQPPRLVFARELRWIFHALRTGIPITNSEVQYVSITSSDRVCAILDALRSLPVDWLTVSLEEPDVRALLLRSCNFGIVKDYVFLRYARTGDTGVLRTDEEGWAQ